MTLLVSVIGWGGLSAIGPRFSPPPEGARHATGGRPCSGRPPGVGVETTYSVMRLNTEKIGMYSAMIIDPMMPPSTAIISGSMRDVSASVVDSTSWS